jgi:putative transposase
MAMRSPASASSYREERLAVRRGGRRKWAIGGHRPMAAARAPGQPWSLDFLPDQTTDIRRVRILAVVDDGTRECLGLAGLANRA